MARNDSLATMTVKIAANTAQFNAAVKQTQGQLKAFSDYINKAAKSFVAGFGAMQVANFTLEVSKLAGEAQGVKAAFDRLPESVKVMQQLKEATGGTVSELELMKRAVTATNFGIDLAALPKLLEFAAVRAQQTGQSVDYLVDSIVTGIGRKSPLILDNLGISTTRLKEKFGGAALEAQSIADVAKAVGAIAEEELGKMGKLSDNAATRMANLSAEWENLKVVIGDSLNAVDDTKAFTLSKMIADLTAFFKVLQDNKIANQITEQKGGIFASLFPNIDQLFSIRELSKEIEKIKDGAREFAKINTEGFIKVPTLGLRIQESINKITEDNRKKELERLEVLKKINEERQKEESRVRDIQNIVKKRLEGYSSGPTVAGFDRSTLSFETPDPSGVDRETVIRNMADAQNALAVATERARESQQKQIDIIMQQREAWASLGSQMSDVIAQTIASGEPLLNSLARIASGVIAQLERIALARMIADSAKFGIGGIVAAAAGFGVVKGLFSKLSKEQSTPVSAPSYQSSGYAPFGYSSVRVYQRGTDMEGTLTETQRLGKRTKG